MDPFIKDLLEETKTLKVKINVIYAPRQEEVIQRCLDSLPDAPNVDIEVFQDTFQENLTSPKYIPTNPELSVHTVPSSVRRCTLNHINAFANTDENKYDIIIHLEDDAVLFPDAIDRLADMHAILPAEHFLVLHNQGKSSASYSDEWLHLRTGRHTGTYAMAMTPGVYTETRAHLESHKTSSKPVDLILRSLLVKRFPMSSFVPKDSLAEHASNISLVRPGIRRGTSANHTPYKMSLVLALYKLPDSDLEAFLDWNNSILSRGDIELAVVTDRPLERDEPFIKRDSLPFRR